MTGFIRYSPVMCGLLPEVMFTTALVASLIWGKNPQKMLRSCEGYLFQDCEHEDLRWQLQHLLLESQQQIFI